MTSKKLASKAHISPSMMSEIENGRYPQYEKWMDAIAKALQVSVVELYGEEDFKVALQRSMQRRLGDDDSENTVDKYAYDIMRKLVGSLRVDCDMKTLQFTASSSREVIINA